MNQIYERTSGVVVEYDDYLGTIVSEDQTEYILKKTEVLEDAEVNVGDQVSFEPDCVDGVEEQAKVARFIKVLRRKETEEEQ